MGGHIENLVCPTFSSSSPPLYKNNDQSLRATSWYLNQFEVSLSSLHIRGVWVFTHEQFMLSSLLGLRRPFLCSRVFCSLLPFHFGPTKVCFDQVWNKKPITLQGTGRHFESVQVVRHILAFVPPPKYTYTDYEQLNLSGMGRKSVSSRFNA